MKTGAIEKSGTVFRNHLFVSDKAAIGQDDRFSGPEVQVLILMFSSDTDDSADCRIYY